MKSGSVLHDLIDQGNWDELHKILSSSKKEDVNCLEGETKRAVLQRVLIYNPKQVVKLVSLLLESKANVDTKDWYGMSPLQNAVGWHGTPVECVKLLLNYGADVNSVNNFGHSVVFRALSNHSRADVICLLIKHGANLAFKNDQGETYLDYVHRFVDIPNNLKASIELLYDAYPVEPRWISFANWFLSIKRKRARFRQTALCVLGVLRRRFDVSRDMVRLLGLFLRSTRFISNWDVSQ